MALCRFSAPLLLRPHCGGLNVARRPPADPATAKQSARQHAGAYACRHDDSGLTRQGQQQHPDCRRRRRPGGGARGNCKLIPTLHPRPAKPNEQRTWARPRHSGSDLDRAWWHGKADIAPRVQNHGGTLANQACQCSLSGARHDAVWPRFLQASGSSLILLRCLTYF